MPEGMVDPHSITVIAMTAIITGGVVIGLIVNAWANRSRGGVAPGRLDAMERQLTRIEQAVNSMAEEVERVGEAHRFTAKLLAERTERPAREQQSGRVITPH
jgi:hypothetical protein